MTDLQRLLEAKAKLTTSEWYADEKYICEVAPEGHSAMVGQWYQDDIKALVFIRNHLRPVLELAQCIEEAAREAHKFLTMPDMSEDHPGIPTDVDVRAHLAADILRRALAQGSEDEG